MVSKTELKLSDITEGHSELSPMELTRTQGLPQDFSCHVAPLQLKIHLEALQADYAWASSHLSHKYLSEREHLLNHPLNHVKEVLATSGFGDGRYKAIGLMEVGTTHLLKTVPAETVKTLNALSPFCRAHYVMAEDQLQIEPHADCRDYRLHGFRIHIPLHNSAFYRFYEGTKTWDYELTPGRAWFVNNALVHSAHNRTGRTRVSILVQMMSDERLLSLLDV